MSIDSCGNEAEPKVDFYKLYIDLKFYNSSSINNVIHDCNIVFANDDIVMIVEKAMDERTVRYSSASYQRDPLKIVNIEGKTGDDIQIYVATSNVKDILKCNKIYFEYRDKRLKKKRKLIQAIDYSVQEGIDKI